MGPTSCRDEYQHGSFELPLSNLEFGPIAGFTDPAYSFEGDVSELADHRIVNHKQHAEPCTLGSGTKAVRLRKRFMQRSGVAIAPKPRRDHSALELRDSCREPSTYGQLFLP